MTNYVCMYVYDFFFFIFVLKRKSRNPGNFRDRDYDIQNPAIFKNQSRLASLVVTTNRNRYMYIKGRSLSATDDRLPCLQFETFKSPVSVSL